VILRLYTEHVAILRTKKTAARVPRLARLAPVAFAAPRALCYRSADRLGILSEGQAMTIKVGDRLPSVTLRQVTPEGPKEVSTGNFFSGKKVVLFAVPGAFTPACSQRHLPGYVDRAAELKAKGIDEIACVAVNDAAVLGAWARDQKSEGKITMLADGSGDFVHAVGLELDLSKGGLGTRSQRYSMLVEDGVVKSLNIEPAPGQVDTSSAETMLRVIA
jgi:glutaredoxin/glutathione-dependent peroxiredoxin